MLVADFSESVKKELEKYKTEEEIHSIANKMIGIIKGHEIVTISKLEMPSK